MAIRLLFDATSANRVSFTLSPLWETVASLHVLSDPKHHAVHLPWVLRTRKSMSADLRRRIRLLEFCWFGPICDALVSLLGGDFTAEIGYLQQLPIEVLASELQRVLEIYVGLGVSSAPADLIAAASAKDPELGRIAQGLSDNPEAIRALLIETLTMYWEQVFQSRWERLEPVLAEDAARRAELYATEGVGKLLRSWEPRMSIDESTGVASLRSANDRTVDLRTGEWLLVPSYYAWPHSWISDRDERPCLIYVASAAQDAARVPLPPAELEHVLVALGSHTRLKIIELLRKRAHSTQDLAYILRMAEGAVSRHLKVLTAAGLLTQKREGYYVLYGLRHSRLRRAAHQIERLAAKP